MYRDNYGNAATIEEVSVLPYKGSPVKERGWRLKVVAEYDNDFCYHISLHPTDDDAIAEMNKMSCGTWKEVR